MTGRLGLVAVLVVLGAGWGATMPLAKVAVSEGYRHFGLIFWQLAIGAAILGAVQTLRGRGLTLGRRQLRFYLVIALLGTVLPNAASYQAAVYLPAGIISILLSTVPLFAFPIALALGADRFGWLRLTGLLAGLLGVVLIAAPGASLPDPAMAIWLPLALVAPAFYALEGNVVAKWGTGGVDPVELLLGASLVGAAIALPMAVATGTAIDPRPPWGAPDLALAASSTIHAVVYAGYVWLVGRAGSVFAAQVSYLVTLFGILWAMLFLGERYGTTVWLAVAVTLAGVFLVQPRPALVVAPPLRHPAPRPDGDSA